MRPILHARELLAHLTEMKRVLDRTCSRLGPQAIVSNLPADAAAYQKANGERCAYEDALSMTPTTESPEAFVAAIEENWRDAHKPANQSDFMVAYEKGQAEIRAFFPKLTTPSSIQ